MTKKMKKIALITGSALVLILVMILGIGQIQKKKVADEAERAQKEYAANLNTITYTMLDACSTAEDCGNLIKSVWSNAIYEESDDRNRQIHRRPGWLLCIRFQ